MPTNVTGKKIAIIGRFAKLSDTDLRRKIKLAGATLEQTSRAEIALVGQLSQHDPLLDQIHRHNTLQRLGPKPRLIEIWNETRVDGEFGDWGAVLTNKAVLIADDGVARPLLVRLVQSRGGRVVELSTENPKPIDVLIINHGPAAQRIADMCGKSKIEIWDAARVLKEFGP